MTVELVMVVKDEAAVIDRCLETVEATIDSWTIIDTGSTDDTADRCRNVLAGKPGQVLERPWVDFGANLTEALELAGDADWLLRLDADMTVGTHPGLRGWLDQDPDPDCDAWMVEVIDAGTIYRLPLLVRAGKPWAYIGRTHEYLDTSKVKRRALHGLTVTHHHDGSNRATKHLRDIELLLDELNAGDPRATFYTAQALECLGELEGAMLFYRQRAAMGGFEEEAWLAEWRAAELSQDVPALLAAWERRPARHEPLTAAARLVRAQDGASDDLLARALD